MFFWTTKAGFTLELFGTEKSSRLDYLKGGHIIFYLLEWSKLKQKGFPELWLKNPSFKNQQWPNEHSENQSK